MELGATLESLVATLQRLEADGLRFVSVAPAAGAAVAPHRDASAPLASPEREQPPAAHQAVQDGTSPQPIEAEGTAHLPTGAGPYAALGSLTELHRHCGDCQICRLGSTRQRIVLGAGHAHPRLMFIGEGPGADEDEQGLPFVGRAGALLTGMILAMGLTREDVFITNVVKCRPPGNRNPEPDEVASCRPILQRQIELLDPALIVTLGNVPLKALNPQAGGITRERGREFMYRSWRVFPTFHPSFLLRSPDAIAPCWEDLRRALRIAYPSV